MPSKKRKSSSRKKGRAKKRSKRSGGGLSALLRTWLVVVAICVGLIGAYILFSKKGPSGAKVPNVIGRRQAASPAKAPEPAPKPPAQVDVTLFFGDADSGYLVPETRKIVRPVPEIDLARAVVEALIDGPQGNLQPTIPKGTRLRRISIDRRGICTVDFNSAFQKNHPGGSTGELFTVYSIIESLTSNLPRIDAVQILVEGSPRETLAGHLFIGEPLRPDSRYIQRQSS
jgi:germination protein M